MIVDKSPIADRTWIADKIGGVDSNLERWNMKYNVLKWKWLKQKTY